MTAQRTPPATGGDALRVVAWPAWANRAYNPYNARLATSLEQAGVEVAEFRPDRPLAAGTDIWHLHWPDVVADTPPQAVAAAKTAAVLGLQRAARRRGTRVVWTVHNLAGHDRRHPSLHAWFWPRFLAGLDGVIALSRSGLHAARERHPALARTPGFVVPHGDYRQDYPRGMGREEARERLGIRSAAPLVLFFGRIREYKQVPQLVEAFRALDGDAHLHVAGLPASTDLAERIGGAADGDPRVSLDLSLLTPEATEVAFAACDVVVLPYRETLNSGTAMLALSYDRPVLLPAHGAGLDLSEAMGPAWVRTFDGEITPDELGATLAWAAGTSRPAEAPMEPFAWPRIGRATAAAYRAVIDGAAETR